MILQTMKYRDTPLEDLVMVIRYLILAILSRGLA